MDWACGTTSAQVASLGPADCVVPEHANFCSSCGSLLVPTSGGGDAVTCYVCGFATLLEQLTPRIGAVSSALDIQPSELLRRLSGKSTHESTGAGEAVVDEECPLCKHKGLSYRTAQLRGLDEGQTIFYTCLNKSCGHKFNLNS